jgi:hypothetical protein
MINHSKESNVRKAKGEKLQKNIEAQLQSAFPQHANAIQSNKMSAHGEDIKITSDEARKDIPYSIEAKYKQKGLANVYAAYEQAERQLANISTALDVYAVAVVQQEGHDPLVVMNVEDWLTLTKQLSAKAANQNGGPK